MQRYLSFTVYILLFCSTIFNHIPEALAAKNSAPAVKVSLNWTYKNFPLKLEVFAVTPLKAPFISETKFVKTLKDAPILGDPLKSFQVPIEGSKPIVLVIKNETDSDAYFFAVPHEVQPVSASAGHFFECLCIGRLYKVPKKSVWYRIVRVNLNSTFQGMDAFTITHQIIGKTEKEALGPEKDQLYSY